jgi:hypothetical protein
MIKSIRFALLPLLGASVALAGSLEFDLNNIYSGSVAPSASTPWLKATFNDVDSTHVTLTLDAVGLVSAEFVTTWAFNLDPSIDSTSVSFSQKSANNYIGTTSISSGSNGQNAGPAHGFDVGFSLDNSPPSDRFGVGSEVVFTLTRAAGLSAANFDFSNSSGDVNTTTGAHVQGIGSDGSQSDWIDPSTSTSPVPEASTVAVPVFAALAAGGIVVRRRLKARK